MFRIRTKTILLALLTLVVGSIATTAQARQCVYNEAGYVAEVRWFHPTDLVVQPGTNVLTFANAAVEPVQNDTITLGFSSCNESAELQTAVVRIVGGEYVVKGIVWGATTLVGVVGAVAGAVGCVGTAGVACPAIAAAYPAAVGAAIQIGGEIAGDGNIPEIFYIGTPSAYFDLKIWGTVFDPQYGDGAAIAPTGLPGMAEGLGPLFASTPIGRISATPIAAFDNVDIGYCMFMCQANQQCTGIDYLVIGFKCELQGTAAAGGNLITDITNTVLGGMPWMHLEFTAR
jgi:hypothetical protein